MLKGLYLTLLIGPNIPVIAPQPVVDALTGIQVTTSAGQRSGFQLTFSISKDSMLNRVLLPSGYFDPKTRVIVVLTLNGTPNVLSDGIITQQSISPSSEPGQSTLTITGEDLTLAMDLEVNRTCYPALPPPARVLVILAHYAIYGIIPMIIPPLELDIDNPVDRVNVQNSTDLTYINQLASDAGYVFYIEPGPVPGTNTAYWGPEVRIGLPQPALSINMDAETNVESLSFTFNGLAREQLVVNITEPITKIQIPIPIPEIGLLRPPLAAKPAVTLKKRPLGCTASLNLTKAILYGLSQTAENSDAISGSGQLDTLRYGHILKARGLVSVRGAGLAYDGFYYVNSVTHDIKRGEYKQSFTLSRDGLISLTPVVMP